MCVAGRAVEAGGGSGGGAWGDGRGGLRCGSGAGAVDGGDAEAVAGAVGQAGHCRVGRCRAGVGDRGCPGPAVCFGFNAIARDRAATVFCRDGPGDLDLCVAGSDRHAGWWRRYGVGNHGNRGCGCDSGAGAVDGGDAEAVTGAIGQAGHCGVGRCRAGVGDRGCPGPAICLGFDAVPRDCAAAVSRGSGPGEFNLPVAGNAGDRARCTGRRSGCQ